MCFANYRSLIEKLYFHRFALVLVAIGMGMMLMWVVLPVPSRLGSALLWTYVPPHRMLWGLGLLLTLSTVLIVAEVNFEFSGIRFLAFMSIIVSSWIGVKVGFPEVLSTTVRAVLSNGYFELVSLMIFGGVFLVKAFRPLEASEIRMAVVACCAATGVLTFGKFNPLQQAQPIFNVPETPLLVTLRAQAKSNPNGWAVVPGGRWALLGGVGIPAINHVLTSPQLDFFRAVFPELSGQTFCKTFNRYAQIVPQPGVQPHSPSPDVIVVPTEPFERNIQALHNSADRVRCVGEEHR